MKSIQAYLALPLMVCIACSPRAEVMAVNESEVVRSSFVRALSSWTKCPEGSSLERLAGVWVDDEGANELALICRNQPGAGIVLFAVIPSGRYEGTATLLPVAGGSGLAGRYTRVNPDLSQSWAVVIPIGEDAVQLQLDGRTLSLRDRRRLSMDHLVRTVIVGHRGASLGRLALMNSLRAVRHARDLGSDGVELDVTTPFRKGVSGREPLTADLRVHHPPEIRAEITGFDSVSVEEAASLPPLNEALTAARSAGLAMVYLDPKVRWLLEGDRQAMNQALETLTTIAAVDAALDRRRWLVIGAEDTGAGGTGEALLHILSKSSNQAAVNLTWAAEFTRGTDERHYVELVTRQAGRLSPMVSINLLRLKGTRGGMLGLLLRDLSPSAEATLRPTAQVIAYWTIHSRAQLEGVLRASDRLSGVSPDRTSIIITPFPHRVAYWLACAG